MYIINPIGLFVKFGNRSRPEFLSPSEGTWSAWPGAISNRKSYNVVRYSVSCLLQPSRVHCSAFGVGCGEVRGVLPFPSTFRSYRERRHFATREREKKKRKETKGKRRRTTRISLKLLRGLIRPIPLLTKTSVCPTLIDFFNPVSPWSIVILAIFSSLSLSLFLGSFPCPTFRLLRLRGTFARLLR